MSTEENTGYISNSSERSTSCQRKKTLVTYRIHQRGPHHVNGRKHWLHIEFNREVHIMSTEEKHWLHIEFIREVHVMPTEENTGYISNSTERSNSCQRKKTLATYRFHQRGPHLFSSVDMNWTSLLNSICNQCFLPLAWRGPLWWIRYVTSVFLPLTWCGPLWWNRYVASVFFRWHDVDLPDEFDM